MKNISNIILLGMVAVVGVFTLDVYLPAVPAMAKKLFNINKKGKHMKILFVLHASFEQPGFIETWAKNNNHSTQTVCPYKGDKLPNANNFDFLVVMGGPQSPLEMDKAPYLHDEIALVKEALQQNKRILGVCLGAQLIGEALGARTERSPHREIGMNEIQLLDAAKDDPVFRDFPAKFDVMHWHSDMPGIPKDAVLLAKSKGCPRQAFRYGDRVYGFQCHFEFTEKVAKGMVANCVNDLATPGEYVKSAKTILEVDYTQINAKLENVLDYLANVPEMSLDLDKEHRSTVSLAMR